jgi:hypothetical protein
MKLKRWKGEIVMKWLADELKGDKTIGVKTIKRRLSIYTPNVRSQKKSITFKIDYSTHFGETNTPLF